MRVTFVLMSAVLASATCNPDCVYACDQQILDKNCDELCGCVDCYEQCTEADGVIDLSCVGTCQSKYGYSFAQLRDQTIEVSSCAEDCQATCQTAPCLSMCLSEFCSPAETGNVAYFFIGVVLFLGIISLTYEVLYSKEIKNRLQTKALRP